MTRFTPSLMRAPMLAFSLLAAAVSGCAGGSRMDINEMTAAMPMDLGAVAPVGTTGDYHIGVGDKLSVRVFQVADLSFDELTVDTSGNLQIPLIGAVRASGQTANELAAEIATRLSDRYLRNPQVTVAVTNAASQKITVDGGVTKPGVYEMQGQTSLLQAVAMAEGPSPVADLAKVAVFRTINGQRAVALFDLGAIRQGRAVDPVLQGDDIVVVDISRLNANLRELVLALPALSVFRLF